MEVPELPGFFTNHPGTTRTRADVSTVRLRLMPMHHDLINRGELDGKSNLKGMMIINLYNDIELQYDC